MQASCLQVQAGSLHHNASQLLFGGKPIQCGLHFFQFRFQFRQFAIFRRELFGHAVVEFLDGRQGDTLGVDRGNVPFVRSKPECMAEVLCHGTYVTHRIGF